MPRTGENRLSYAASAMSENKTNYLNLVKDLSWLNSKNYEHSTRKGHVYGYLVDIDIVDAQVNQYALLCVPNTWKTRNAWRKFHFHRDMMFDQSGVTDSERGKYGQTMRPYMDSNMYETETIGGQTIITGEYNTLIPVGCTDSEREWTYTELASSPQFDTDVTMQDIELAPTDTWALALLGTNDIEDDDAGIKTYVSAAMVHSYNLDRMEVVTPDAEESISGPNNPLAALRSQTMTSGEVLEIAAEQETEAPPYDIRDAGDSTDAIITGYGNTNTETLQKISIHNVFVPAGILAIVPDTAPSATSFVTVTVNAIVECRDWA